MTKSDVAPQQLEGAVALVTGGGSGIGAAVARALAAGGARVRVADVDVAAARAVADRIGGDAVELDVRDPAAWNAVTASDDIDLALLAAGVIGPRTVIEADPDDVERAIGVDLLGVMHGTGALAASMRRRGRGGAVVAVSSAAGLFPMPLAPAYGAAKWGVVGWVLSAAPVLEADGVVLTAVCPAWTDTPFLSADDRALLDSLGAAVMPVERVVEQVLRLLLDGRPGEVVHVDAEHGAVRAQQRPRFTPLDQPDG